MNIGELKKTYKGKDLIITTLLLSNITLVIALVFFAVIHSQQKAIITLNPPGLSEKTIIEYKDSDNNYKMAWGKYMAHNLGNVTPRTAKFTKLAVEQMLAPSIYQDAIKVLTSQLQSIKRDKLSLSFDMRKVSYEKTTDKVFVYGFSVVELPTGNRKQSEHTYEFVITIDNYMPNVSHLSSYPGPPRTLDEIEKQNRNKPKKKSDDNDKL